MGLLHNLSGYVRYGVGAPQAVQPAPPQTPTPTTRANGDADVDYPRPAPTPGSSQNAGGGIQNPHEAQPLLGGEFFTTMVDAVDRAPEKSRIGGNVHGYMHASSLIGLACKRQSVIAAQHGVEHYEELTGGHRIMFAQGRATEKHIRDAVLKRNGNRNVFGMWRCRCKRAEHWGFAPREDHVCNVCGHPLDRYGEPQLLDHELRITGSPDLSYMLQRYMVVGEIKSMAPEMFDALERPNPDQLTQPLIYRALYQRMGFDVHDYVSIIYGRKQFKWGGRGRVYKEYVVDATTRLHRQMVDDCFDIAAEIAHHNRMGTLPRRTVCGDPSDKKAKKCPVAHLCFNYQE